MLVPCHASVNLYAVLKPDVLQSVAHYAVYRCQDGNVEIGLGLIDSLA